MPNPTLRRQRLAALFLLGLLLWFSPLVLRFEQAGAVFGIPLLYLYLFGVWADARGCRGPDPVART